jgi:hypothetical protein
MCRSTHSVTQFGRAFRGEATRLFRPRTVTGDGDRLVSRGGLVWQGEVADRSGLTAGLSQVVSGAPRRCHDPGVCLVQLVVALADGAECLPDLEAFRGQPEFVRAGGVPVEWRPPRGPPHGVGGGDPQPAPPAAANDAPRGGQVCGGCGQRVSCVGSTEGDAERTTEAVAHVSRAVATSGALVAGRVA